MKKLIVLKKPNCMPCDMVRRHLDGKLDDINHEIYNVEESDGMEIAAMYGAMGAPTLVALDEHGIVIGKVTGFKAGQIDTLLSIVRG